jgi:hypothetical protein
MTMNTTHEETKKTLNEERTTEEEFKLESKKATAPSGVSAKITSSPHRNGNPDHRFYEAWFRWDGGTLRTSTIIHDEATRVMTSEFIEDLTGFDYYDLLSDTLNKYDWHTNA